MKSLQDTLYNWLTIKIVKDARPDDTAAVETEKMFRDMIFEEHGLTDIEIEKDEVMYYILYNENGERKKVRYPRDLIEIMLDQINKEPEKFVNYPEE